MKYFDCLPDELKNKVYSYVGEHPIAHIVKERFKYLTQISYMLYDDISDEEHSELSFFSDSSDHSLSSRDSEEDRINFSSRHFNNLQGEVCLFCR
jgi:hypothetical protein